MPRMNLRFMEMLDQLRAQPTLDAALTKIADLGIVERNGCYLLASECQSELNVTEGSFSDKTGFECFVNHIHIDEMVAADIAQQAVGFAQTVLRRWNAKKPDMALNAIIGVDGGEATVRFHLKRLGEKWLADDLEGYSEAILEIASTDRTFSEFQR